MIRPAIKVKKTCPVCGIEFETHKHRIDEGNGKVCSRKCQYELLKKRVIRVCPQCGKEFTCVQSDIDHGRGKYCSKSCQSDARKLRIKKQCPTCGKEFLTIPAVLRKGQGKYCSRYCAIMANRTQVVKICLVCGKTFTARGTQLAIGGGRYCSNECVGIAHRGENCPAWKGGISFEPYCPKFNNEFKERVRAFFGYQCVECGYAWHEGEPRLAVHHVTFNKETCCDSSVPLFVPLCKSCHMKTGYRRDFWQQHFTDMINQYYGGRCYLTKEETKALKSVPVGCLDAVAKKRMVKA